MDVMEKMTFCHFTGHERHIPFSDIFIFIMGVPPSNFVVLVSIVFTKGLFLTSTTPTLPILMKEMAVVLVLDIQLTASSRISSYVG